MIEPVFVGLLATAFGFLFLQLVGVVRELNRETKEQMKNEEFMLYLWEWYRRKKRKYKDRYRGRRGLVLFYSDTMRGMGLGYLGVLMPLVLYVVSIWGLVVGYWFEIDIALDIGLSFLIGAFVACGVGLCFYYGFTWWVFGDQARYFAEVQFERLERNEKEEGV